MSQRVCKYCQEPFRPSKFHPEQQVCLKEDCQRKRRNEYHRRKRERDPEYRQTCLDSQKKWRDAHPEYQQEYRRNNPGVVAGNREKQRDRDRQRRLKQRTAAALKAQPLTCWVMASVDNLDKNNLASSDLIVLQRIVSPSSGTDLDKNNLAPAQHIALERHARAGPGG